MKTQDKILSIPIDLLEISDELKGFVRSQGFNSLYPMLAKYSASELLSKKGFDHGTLIELYNFLKRFGLENAITE